MSDNWHDRAEVFVGRLDRLGHVLSVAGRRVADFIARNPAAALASSALELGASTGTSDATVVRTVQALGYAGLPQLKQALVAQMDGHTTPADDMRRTLKELTADTSQALEAVLAAHAEGLLLLRAPAFRAQLDHVVPVLHKAARIVTFGIGPSAILARYATLLLARTGRRSRCLDGAGIVLADQLLDLRAGDAVLILAYGRPYREVTSLLAEARRLLLPSVLVSDRQDGPVAEAADLLLTIARGMRQRVALHGCTLVGLEALMLALAAVGPDRAVAALERLNALRGAVGGQRFDVDEGPAGAPPPGSFE